MILKFTKSFWLEFLITGSERFGPQKREICQKICPLFQELNFCLLVSSAYNYSHKVWTQIRPDKMSGLIWVQTV